MVYSISIAWLLYKKRSLGSDFVGGGAAVSPVPLVDNLGTAEMSAIVGK